MKQNAIKLNVFENLKADSLHQRELSRKIGINQTQTRRILDEMVNENILSYKILGKNKSYFIKESIEAIIYEKLSENEKLLDILKNNAIRRICKEIYEALENGEIMKERIIVLFGSYARGNYDGKSDIDIYINSESKKEKAIIENISEKINVKLGKFDKNGLLEKEIIKSHIILNNIEGFINLVK